MRSIKFLVSGIIFGLAIGVLTDIHAQVGPTSSSPRTFTTPFSIAIGGTNGTTKTAAFDNLSPLTTRGDIITRDATNNVRFAKCGNGLVLGWGANDPTCLTMPQLVMNAASGNADGISPSAGSVLYYGGNFFSDASAVETNNGALVIPVSGTLRAISCGFIVLGVVGTAGENFACDLRLYDSSGTLQTTVTGPTIDTNVGASKMKSAGVTGLSTAITAGWIWRIRLTAPGSFTSTPTVIFPTASIYTDTP